MGLTTDPAATPLTATAPAVTARSELFADTAKVSAAIRP